MAQEYFVIAHWSTLIENLSESPTKLYELIEAGVRKRQIPDVAISQAEMKEGGLFSAKRLYFTVERKNYCFDVCAVPFGTGFFVSSWLSYTIGGLLKRILFRISFLPVIGGLFAPFVEDVTLYQRDTADAFQKSVHHAVLEVIDDITKTRGLKMLGEAERKPMMSEFYLPKSLKR